MDGMLKSIAELPSEKPDHPIVTKSSSFSLNWTENNIEYLIMIQPEKFWLELQLKSY